MINYFHRLDEESLYWDLDNIEHDPDQIDIFSETMSFEKFNNLIKEVN